jgi:hypothetical protein
VNGFVTINLRNREVPFFFDNIQVAQAEVVTALALDLRVLSSQMTIYDTNRYQQSRRKTAGCEKRI